MKYRFAFVGFRHPHILSLWEGVKNHPRCEIVAACEQDPDTRKALNQAGAVTVTHDDFERMLAEVPCDVVAIGDVYARRGALCIRALETGRHIISDKPICTDMSELKKITTLAKEKKLSVGCQLDLVEFPAIQRLRDIISQGLVGKVCTVTILAQHPLRLGNRAAWYFEPGYHGGTINDLGIHVFDLVPWLTGRRWTHLVSSRQWNAKAEAVPHFKDCAQIHGTLEDSISCFADVSYLAPDVPGYDLPHYWRITVHGTKGMAETNLPGNGHVILARNDEKAIEEYSGLRVPALRYLDDFLDELNGKSSEDGVTTQRVLHASRLALEAQQVADADVRANDLAL